MISWSFSAILAIATIALRWNSDDLVSCDDVPSFHHGGTGRRITGDHSFNANGGEMHESFADSKFKNLRQLHQKDNTGPDISEFRMQLHRKEYTVPDGRSLAGVVVNNGLQEGDLQLLQDIVPDASRLASEDEDRHPPAPESQEALDQAINAKFDSIVSNLARNAGSAGLDSKLEAIKRAMESAFLKTAGYVDHAYVDGALDMIRAEVKQLKAAEDAPQNKLGNPQ